MRALVLSGGGQKGAVQVGVLKYLLKDLKRHYDIMTGISVGALNVAALSMYKKGEEEAAFDFLYNIWMNVSKDKVYKSWFPFGILQGLFKSSLYNSEPLHDLVHSIVDVEKVATSGKRVAVGAVSLNSGKCEFYHQDSPFFVDAVLASSSYPAMLCPVKINGELWTDGGVKEITPLKKAMDMGATEIDVIVADPDETTLKFEDDPNFLDMIKRTMTLMADEISVDDVKKALLYNELAKLGYEGKKYIPINVYKPKVTLSADPLAFDHGEILNMIDVGYRLAKE